MFHLQVRPEPDKVMQDIADYVHNYEVSRARAHRQRQRDLTPFRTRTQIKSDLAYNTARLCLIDTIGCGLEGLRVSEECRALMDPIVPGTTVPNGTKIPGTPYQMDPVSVSPFASGTRIVHGNQLLTSDLFTVAAPLLSAPRSAGSTLTSEWRQQVSLSERKVRKWKLTLS